MFYLNLFCLFFINLMNFLVIFINCGKFFFNEVLSVLFELINIKIIFNDDKFNLL